MASAKLPVTVGEVSAEAFREVKEKSAAKNTNKNDKKVIFLVFSYLILFSWFAGNKSMIYMFILSH